jgi:hypothetical protein
MKHNILIAGIASLLFSMPARAQHEEAASFKPKHSLGFAIGHAHVFEGRDAEGNKSTLALPMWALDYNFQFARKWMIGLHTDMIVETFEVEKHLESGEEGEVVERSQPIAPAIMGMYKPNHHWSFGFGIGGEFAKEENFLLNRVAVEYSVELPKNWEVYGAIQYDFRWEAYDTWTIGVGFTKNFGKTKAKKD